MGVVLSEDAGSTFDGKSSSKASDELVLLLVDMEGSVSLATGFSPKNF